MNFSTPNQSERRKAIGDTGGLSEKLKKAFDWGFDICSRYRRLYRFYQ